MFTIGAFLAFAAIAWFTDRHQRGDPDDVEVNIKHTRQDLRLVAYLLAAILVMLGIIADKIH